MFIQRVDRLRLPGQGRSRAARTGSNRLESARFCSFLLVSARFGSSRLVSARFCSFLLAGAPICSSRLGAHRLARFPGAENKERPDIRGSGGSAGQDIETSAFVAGNGAIAYCNTCGV
ncbi:MAG TPA: hypothetical protein VGS12_15620 [Caulobacteraceae bacterium]|nr:hypothetical protein [Caulobacteraceae bacterium]